MKKIFMIFLITCFFAVNCYAMDNADVMLERGILIGDEGGLRLDDPVTDIEMVVMIIRFYEGDFLATQLDLYNKHSRFNHWAEPYLVMCPEEIGFYYLYFKEQLEKTGEITPLKLSHKDCVNIVYELLKNPLDSEKQDKIKYLESAGYNVNLLQGESDITRKEALEIIYELTGKKRYSSCW